MKHQTKPISAILMILFSSIVIFSCQPNQRQEKIDRIHKLEKTLFETKKGIIDKKEASNMIYAYTQYADAFPHDSASANYLFKAADVSINTFHSQQTIALFNRILTDYPNYSKAPQALFLKAFTFENYLSQLDSAKVNYSLFLKKYPHHPFANDAQISLDNLGKTPEEIIKEFKDKEGK
jgi:TolA-binding protein